MKVTEGGVNSHNDAEYVGDNDPDAEFGGSEARRRAIDANRWVGSLRCREAAYFGSPLAARCDLHAWGGLYLLISALARVRAPWCALSRLSREKRRRSPMYRILANVHSQCHCRTAFWRPAVEESRPGVGTGSCTSSRRTARKRMSPDDTKFSGLHHMAVSV